MFEEKTISALRWIIGILEHNNVRFRIAGGFAARVYGSDRAFADIDIEILEKDMKKVFDIVKNSVTFSLGQYKDENWDLPLMTLEYKEQVIDIFAGDNIKMYNVNTRLWEKYNFNIDNFVTKSVQGVEVPLIPLSDLIDYKKKLQREVDMIDVKNLEY